jgi:hypothetical protein
LAGGCATPERDAAPETWLLGEVVPIAPGDAVHADLSTFPAEVGVVPGASIRLLVEEGPTPRASATLSIEPADDGHAAALMVFAIEGEERFRWRRAIARDDEGRWLLHRFDDGDRWWRTEFTPPSVILDAGATPGAPIERGLAIRVSPLHEPEKTSHKGRGTFTMEIVGRQRVRGPAGPVDAIVVRTTLDSRFGVASATSETETWLAHPEGLIAERSEEVIRVLGIETERKRWMYRRAWDGPGAP